MRSSEQISRTPAQWAQHQRDERSAALRGLLAYLRARRHEHWYRWVTEGQPPLTQDEYERHRVMRPRGRR